MSNPTEINQFIWCDVSSMSITKSRIVRVFLALKNFLLEKGEIKPFHLKSIIDWGSYTLVVSSRITDLLRERAAKRLLCDDSPSQFGCFAC